MTACTHKESIGIISSKRKSERAKIVSYSIYPCTTIEWTPLGNSIQAHGTNYRITECLKPTTKTRSKKKNSFVLQQQHMLLSFALHIGMVYKIGQPVPESIRRGWPLGPDRLGLASAWSVPWARELDIGAISDPASLNSSMIHVIFLPHVVPLATSVHGFLQLELGLIDAGDVL
jgi:hypothetical protein